MSQINLGDRVKDRITGYQGIVVAITYWLNKCTRITVQSEKLKDEKPVDSSTFDDTDVVFVNHGLNVPAKRKTGGPGRAADPAR